MLGETISDICKNVVRIITDDNNNFVDHDIIIVSDYIADIYTWLYVDSNIYRENKCASKLDEITEYMEKNHPKIWEKIAAQNKY